MNDLKTTGLDICLIGALALQSACGTIMHPERKGQRGGRIDAGIAVLDGLGLLLFIIPGVIAFAVDFSNGTIYLPGTNKSAQSLNELRRIPFDPNGNAQANAEEALREKAGLSIRLDRKDARVLALHRLGDIPAALSRGPSAQIYLKTAFR